MKAKSSLNLIVGLVIVLGLLPALAVAAPANPQTPQTGKIEDQLLDLFAVKGSSDFMVRFAEQANLSPAYSMGWDARGEFVVNALTAAAGTYTVTLRASNTCGWSDYYQQDIVIGGQPEPTYVYLPIVVK